LDHLKGARQTKLRRALPDALDVLVVCLQGGLSVMASMSRVANELVTAHPMLAMEFKIAERQMQMGQTAGEAIRGIADRFDMEELRGMAAVIKQAERIGASIAAAMEVFAETLRLKRHQRAEELAHKAAVKILIPTVLFIFPGDLHRDPRPSRHSDLQPTDMWRAIKCSSRCKFRRRSRAGSDVLETALMLPLFILIIVGMIEFGRGFMVQQMVTNAAREGPDTRSWLVPTKRTSPAK
jgi:hypothetical protein